MITIFLGMVIYGGLHSLLAGGRVKRYIRRRFGERAYHGLYRLLYNIIALATILPVLWLLYTTPGEVVWIWPEVLRPVAFVIQCIGTVGLVISLLQIDLRCFLGLSQAHAYFTGSPLPLPHEPLQTSGLYALVRHPLYFFSLLSMWPLPVMTETMLALNLGVTAYLLVGSLLEERRMIAAFGQAYLDYRRRVPWMIPFLHIRREDSHQTLA